MSHLDLDLEEEEEIQRHLDDKEIAWTPLRTRKKGMTDSIFTTFLRVEWGTRREEEGGGDCFTSFCVQVQGSGSMVRMRFDA